MVEVKLPDSFLVPGTKSRQFSPLNYTPKFESLGLDNDPRPRRVANEHFGSHNHPASAGGPRGPSARERSIEEINRVVNETPVSFASPSLLKQQAATRSLNTILPTAFAESEDRTVNEQSPTATVPAGSSRMGGKMLAPRHDGHMVPLSQGKVYPYSHLVDYAP